MTARLRCDVIDFACRPPIQQNHRCILHQKTNVYQPHSSSVHQLYNTVMTTLALWSISFKEVVVARCEIPILVLLGIGVFWVVMLCCVSGSHCSEGVCDLCRKGQAVQEEDCLIREYAGIVNLQNVRNHLPSDTASHHRRPESWDCRCVQSWKKDERDLIDTSFIKCQRDATFSVYLVFL